MERLSAPLSVLLLCSAALPEQPVITSLTGNTENMTTKPLGDGSPAAPDAVAVLGEYLQGAAVWFASQQETEVQVSPDGRRLSARRSAAA